MWANSRWQQSFFTADAKSKDYLAQYGQVFNAVEGNTSFYATPSAQQVDTWLEQSSSHFRFCFKLPKSVTHSRAGFQTDELSDFFARLEPLGERLGPFMLQLPPHISFEALADIKRFLSHLPAQFEYTLELRHQSFFERDENEKVLNQILQRLHIDRMSFDTRALFDKAALQSEAIADARAKKPRFAPRAYAFAKHPSIRFIGFPWLDDAKEEEVDRAINHSLKYFTPWLEHISSWLKEGKEPYLFIHTADNAHAPRLAYAIYDYLQQGIPALVDLTRTPKERADEQGQIGLF